MGKLSWAFGIVGVPLVSFGLYVNAHFADKFWEGRTNQSLPEIRLSYRETPSYALVPYESVPATVTEKPIIELHESWIDGYEKYKGAIRESVKEGELTKYISEEDAMAFVAAYLSRETNFDHNNYSYNAGSGIAQITVTAWEDCCTDMPWDEVVNNPEANIRASARIAKKAMDSANQYASSEKDFVKKTAIAYNAGRRFLEEAERIAGKWKTSVYDIDVLTEAARITGYEDYEEKARIAGEYSEDVWLRYYAFKQRN